ncbi:hypothetical protein AMTR_s04985p00006050 [Amborella trichopoda]|uniref:Uncharacterized protein n=1 Tax=Amborella trichopoda TaxID=13333 RepID=U5CUS9_AMBTC|nr:hypothetical protein AMTR_s04985p00006050 [Amborella trichopoda]
MIHFRHPSFPKTYDLASQTSVCLSNFFLCLVELLSSQAFFSHVRKEFTPVFSGCRPFDLQGTIEGLNGPASLSFRSDIHSKSNHSSIEICDSKKEVGSQGLRIELMEGRARQKQD